ncbi:hypothetical protein OnM2_027081 [Erysiphe neolycopersici]|uniref:Uncharacterized protein n=1 Tax=Erysiphe neolycopersici TaxID=212602 RepID=A0A420I0J8_9PEZI|nr:hypothetical protein OnM2_027081 [Erysiphe neolycopersici]
MGSNLNASKTCSLKKALSIENSGSQNSKKLKRPSVYDAVAGRISASGFISKSDYIPHTRDTSSSTRTPLPPEHVLFRSKNAPTRFAEYDIYFENERNDVSDLPDSDLLKALHAYTADFYSKTTSNKGITDWKSLDGTALIALGILTEELVKDIIGETGDLALTEGQCLNTVKDIQARKNSTTCRRPSKKRQKTKSSNSE